MYSMEHVAPEAKWLTLSEETNSLDYLERAALFVRETPDNIRAWKWVVISLQGALYGFAVAAARGTDYQKVLTKKGKLLGIWDVLKMCQDPVRMKMLIYSKHLQLTKQQEESIRVLVNLLRNRFEHFIPTTWSIELHGLPQVTIDVLEVIRFLALETRGHINLTETGESLVENLVYETIDFIKGTDLYAELKLGQELYKKGDSK